MEFFKKTLDPVIALSAIAVLDIFLFLIVGAWTVGGGETMMTGLFVQAVMGEEALARITFGEGNPMRFDVGLNQVIGLFLFGIGMVLAGACTVSTWVKTGEGNIGALWALLFTFVGMFLFSLVWSANYWPPASATEAPGRRDGRPRRRRALAQDARNGRDVRNALGGGGCRMALRIGRQSAVGRPFGPAARIDPHRRAGPGHDQGHVGDAVQGMAGIDDGAPGGRAEGLAAHDVGAQAAGGKMVGARKMAAARGVHGFTPVGRLATSIQQDRPRPGRQQAAQLCFSASC